MRSEVLLSAALLLAAAPSAQQPSFDENANVKTGPEVGERIPPFRAQDQNDNWIDFESLKGPNGAVLLFHRSADW